MTAAAQPGRRDDRREQLRGHGAMVLFAACVGGSFSIGARAVPHIDPSALIALRFALAVGVAAGMVLAAGAAVRRSPAASLAGLRALTQAIWRFPLLGGLYAAYFVLMFEALRITEPAPLSAVFTLTPLMSAGFALLFLGAITPPRVLVALLVGGAGALWVIFRGDLDRLLALDVGLGEALFFVGAAAYAAYTPLARVLNRGEAIPVFIFGVLSGALLVTAAAGAAAIAETAWTALPPIVWIAAFYLAVVTTAGTASLLQFATLRLPAPKVMAYTYLVPSFVIFYEGLAGAGWASPVVWPGVAVTLIALGLLLRTE